MDLDLDGLRWQRHGKSTIKKIRLEKTGDKI